MSSLRSVISFNHSCFLRFNFLFAFSDGNQRLKLGGFGCSREREQGGEDKHVSGGQEVGS